MRVHRIYLPHLTEQVGADNTQITLRGREAHHLANVLRAAAGQAVRAFDGRGYEADGVVVQTREEVVLELSSAHLSNLESNWHVHLAVGLLKGDKLADVVRQATELGAVSVQPFTSRFGDVPKASPNKLQRWRRIAQEAAKQSGRSLVPEVADPVAVGVLEPHDLGIVAHPYALDHLQAILERHPLPEHASLTLITGAEGGLADSEIDQLTAKGFHAVSLGQRILRAETAPVALLAALLMPEGR